GCGVTDAVVVQEHMRDFAARHLNMDPLESRRGNMIRLQEFPYVSATGLQYDSSSSTEALQKAADMVGYEDFRKHQRAERAKGRYLGLGIATYIEMTTFGTRYWAPLGIQHCAYDSATVRMDPGGGVL